MTEFKVGDRVKVVDPDDERFGAEFVVTSVHENRFQTVRTDSYYVCGVEGTAGEWGAWPEFLELVK